VPRPASTGNEDVMQISSSSWTQDLSTFQQDMFKKIDADGSGGISKDELSAFVANGPGGSASSNSASGGLSIDQIFSQIDTNGDGTIDQSENNAFLQAHQPPHGAGGPHRGHRGHGHHDTDTLAEALFSKADTDGNGTVTADQLKAALPQSANSDAFDSLLDSADTDGDGVITLAELQASFKQHEPQPTSYTRNGDAQTGSTGSTTISVVG
jgi:Ca2+-binding EF-hand superfamily protein